MDLCSGISDAGLKKTTAFGLLFFVILVQATQAQFDREFWCYDDETNPGPEFPYFPRLFSARIQANFETSGFSSEIIRKYDTQRKRDYVEIKNGTRHNTYISLMGDDAFIHINYTSEGPICNADTLSQIEKDKIIDSDPNGMIKMFLSVERRVFYSKEGFKIRPSRDFIRGIPTISWKICEYFADLGAILEVNVYFSDESWQPANPRYPNIGDPQIKNDIVRIQAHFEGTEFDEDDRIAFTIDYYDYQPLLLQDKDFEVPEAVNCPGYRGSTKSVVDSLNYFSYKSEMINYTTAEGTAPIVSYRTVSYDFKYGLSRVDYTEAVQSKDSYSPLDAKVRTIIYDFNSGIQYSFEPLFGSCSVDTIKSALDVFGATERAIAKMMEPASFFYLNVSKNQEPLSYKGVYETRGLPVDVFSRRVTIKGKDRNVFWYFTSDKTSLIEDNVEKNVLVKMVSRPVIGSGSIGKEDTIEINFYDFQKDEPSGFVFDITPCFNESLVKEFVMTFPGNFHIYLDDAYYLLKTRMQKTLQDIAGVSRHRVSIQQIYFKAPYLLIQFKILDLPLVQGNLPFNENKLEKAVAQLQEAVDKGTFTVELRTSDNKNIILKPEPNGLKEFQGEGQKQPEQLYHESSFVGMSIGMTVLGFLLGGIVVNLIMTRKFGVSLLQTSGASSGANAFNNPLNESSI